MRRILLAVVTLALASLSIGCNLAASKPSEPNVQATELAATIAALQTAGVTSTATLVRPTPTADSPQVIEATLCWRGPGPAYEVVSALKISTRVEIIGKGSISGWWIVRNPIYHDPCWVMASAIRIVPGYDLGNLQIFFPPPTPTFTPSPTSTPTPTPTP